MLSLLLFNQNCVANMQNLMDIDANTEHIITLFESDPELLNDEIVINLSQRVIKDRAFYSNDTLGMIFSLLADIAINKGDLTQAIQFSKDGESLPNISKHIRLALLLKITDGYYLQGRYQLALQMSEKSVQLSQALNAPKHLIKALSLRAMTYALNLNHEQAFVELLAVEKLLVEHPEFADHIAVISVLANAHFYMQEYQTAATLFQQVLMLRYNANKEGNINRTYYGLAKSYFKLNRFDDAYSAYWESIQLSKKRNVPIHVAYGKMGIGQVLLQQGKIITAIDELEEAKEVFQQENLANPLLTTLINLAKASLLHGENDVALTYFVEAENIAKRVDLTYPQIELYLLLSKVYYRANMVEEAYASHVKYLDLYQKFSRFDHSKIEHKNHGVDDSQKRRELSLDMAEKTALQRQFSQKYSQQAFKINVLYIVIVIFFIFILMLLWRARALRLNLKYQEIEKPIDYIATPTQTKRFYQQQFKMARKYQYPLIVGYFSIDNWRELEFHFNKKIVMEVSRTVAKLVNKFAGEFDQVGLINQGEYLFLCPHQNDEYLKNVFTKLNDALKVQFFANLGEFSIKISYDYQTTNIQDIDPYVFLSSLSESTRAKYSSYKT